MVRVHARRAAVMAAVTVTAPPAVGHGNGGNGSSLEDRLRSKSSPLVRKMAAEHGVKVYTVGIGTKAGEVIGFEGWSMRVRLDEETLKAIAKVTGGEYFHAGTASDLRAVYQNLNAKLASQQGGLVVGQQVPQHRELALFDTVGRLQRERCAQRLLRLFRRW